MTAAQRATSICLEASRQTPLPKFVTCQCRDFVPDSAKAPKLQAVSDVVPTFMADNYSTTIFYGIFLLQIDFSY